MTKLLIAPPSKKAKRTHWEKNRAGLPLPSHVPILIKGDRASYSLAVRRGTGAVVNDPTGAYCEDWEALERALLGVNESTQRV